MKKLLLVLGMITCMFGMTACGAAVEEVDTYGITEEQAFEYALERCLFGSQEDKREFKSMLIEWFFSGNFIKEEKENE